MVEIKRVLMIFGGVLRSSIMLISIKLDYMIDAFYPYVVMSLRMYFCFIEPLGLCVYDSRDDIPVNSYFYIAGIDFQ